MSELASREKRQWYVVHDGAVVWADGYICEANPGYWWFPTLGVSAGEGFHVFADVTVAVAKARLELTRELDSIQRKLAQLSVSPYYPAAVPAPPEKP